MGKWLVKIGLKIQTWWSRVLCGWNNLVSKLLINVSNCPHKACICNK